MPNLDIYINEIKKTSRQIDFKKPITDEETNIISDNIAKIINLYNLNSNNVLSNCTSTNKFKNGFGNPTDSNYQRKIDSIKLATNVLLNIKKIILSNQNNYTNIIKIIKTFIIDYNNKLSSDMKVKEITDFTNAFNDLINTITNNILKIQ